MMAKAKFMAALTLGAAFCASPALADVETGVQAWTRGDYAAAIKAWKGPADAGDPDALFNLGQAYRAGLGVKQDLAKAEVLFGQAAARGHAQAADNYGLLLFQRGEHARALPYVQAAVARGDPRAAYLLGVAHFNGDIVAKDWVRAYALATVAQQAGLEQARSAIAQMDQYIPLDQRQQGVALAAQLSDEAAANRARQMAAADLGAQRPPSATAAAPLPQRSPVVTSLPNSGFPPPSAAVAAAAATASGESARTAGADYARPTAPPPRPAPVAVARPAPRPPVATSEPAPTPRASASGPWRVQLGAFGVAGNAEAMWARVRGRPELAGHGKLLVPAGSVTKLQAGGFASEADARSACARLSAAGFSCLATRN